MLKQYRYENNIKVDNYDIGKENGSNYTVISDGISYDWNNGEMCYATKKPRRLHIEYHCDQSTSADGRVSAVSESEFCQYYLDFYTPHVCPFVSNYNEQLNEIHCFEQ